jgi:hypothetical protein
LSLSNESTHNVNVVAFIEMLEEFFGEVEQLFKPIKVGVDDHDAEKIELAG